MRRIVINDKISDNFILAGAKAHHLARVLRIKPGELLSVVDCDGSTAIVEVAEVQADAVAVKVVNFASSSCEPHSQVNLVLALLKNDKLDWIIQKAVELGVYEIALFNARNSVSKPDGDSMAKKLIRLEKIAAAATEQCGRSLIPRIFYEPKLTTALAGLTGAPAIFALHEGELAQSLREQLRKIDNSSVALIIGPEGGLVDDELSCVQQLVTAGLGPRVLRAETAALAALTIALSQFGDLG
ncbi:MAG: RsmE family RNA methyltransferase [Negativicutes bacterium]|jgi:16S rRNA (uracil1498-N3)-methyltransferase